MVTEERSFFSQLEIWTRHGDTILVPASTVQVADSLEVSSLTVSVVVVFFRAIPSKLIRNAVWVAFVSELR